MNNIVVIQARMGSTRLPGKVLLPLQGKPLLMYLIDNLLEHFNRTSIIVATSTLRANDAIIECCTNNNIIYYRGSETNVFSRYEAISKMSNVENIIRLTADNPFIDGSYVSDCLRNHIKSSCLYSSTREIQGTNIIRYSPKGCSIDIINKNAFKSVDMTKLSLYDQEHVIPIFYRIIDNVNIMRNITKETTCISIDTIEDYQAAKEYAYDRASS